MSCPQVYARYEIGAEINWTDLNLFKWEQTLFIIVSKKIKLGFETWIMTSKYVWIKLSWVTGRLGFLPTCDKLQPFHLQICRGNASKACDLAHPGLSDSMYEVNTSGTARSYKDFEYKPLLIMFSRTWRACSSGTTYSWKYTWIIISNSFSKLTSKCLGSNPRFCFSFWNSIKLSTLNTGVVMNLTNKSK